MVEVGGLALLLERGKQFLSTHHNESSEAFFTPVWLVP